MELQFCIRFSIKSQAGLCFVSAKTSTLIIFFWVVQFILTTQYSKIEM